MRGYHPFNAKKPCFDEFSKDFGSFFIPNITGDHADDMGNEICVFSKKYSSF